MLKIKRGDTKPDLYFYEVCDENGQVMDLTLVKSIFVKAHRKDVLVFNREITSSGTSDGTCHMHWQAGSAGPPVVVGDTDVPGRLKIELQITFVDDSQITIPNDGYFEVDVTKDLDSTATPD